MKEPIPFDQVSSNSWLLDSSTDLADYATRVFRAEILFDVWVDRDKRHLHAVVRLGGADDCTPFAPTLWGHWLTWFVHQNDGGETIRIPFFPLVATIAPFPIKGSERSWIFAIDTGDTTISIQLFNPARVSNDNRTRVD